LEVWDEPTAHLSVQGVEDLLDFMYDRAHNDGKQLWLVDHRSLDAGYFDGGVTVAKTEFGSTIESQ